MIIDTTQQKQRRSHRSNEGRIQAECVTWFWNSFPQYRGLLFHVPNENDRSDSNFIQGAIRKSLGVVPGVSDLILLVPSNGHGALCIEMKDEHGAQRQSQKEWQKLVVSFGYRYEVCRSLEQFQDIIDSYLNI